MYMTISEIIALVSAVAVVAAAAFAWRAVRVYREQVHVAGFLQLVRLMQERRTHRAAIFLRWNEHQSQRSANGEDLDCDFVKVEDEDLQSDMHEVACDFDDFGVLLYHGLVARTVCLDLWAKMVVRHWETWLKSYVQYRRRVANRPRYLVFAEWLASETENYRDSLCPERRLYSGG